MKDRYQKYTDDVRDIHLAFHQLEAGLALTSSLEEITASGNTEDGEKIMVTMRQGEKELPDGSLVHYTDCIKDGAMLSRSCDIEKEKESEVEIWHMQQDSKNASVSRGKRDLEDGKMLENVTREYCARSGIKLEAMDSDYIVYRNGLSAYESIVPKEGEASREDLFERLEDGTLRYQGNQPKDLAYNASHVGVLFSREQLDRDKDEYLGVENYDGPYTKSPEELNGLTQEMNSLWERTASLVPEMRQEITAFEPINYHQKIKTDIDYSAISEPYQNSDLNELLHEKETLQQQCREARTLKAQFRHRLEEFKRNIEIQTKEEVER